MKKLVSKVMVVFVLSFGVFCASHTFAQSGAQTAVNTSSAVQLCEGSGWEWTA